MENFSSGVQREIMIKQSEMGLQLILQNRDSHSKTLRSILEAMMSTMKYHPYSERKGSSYIYVIFTAWNRKINIGETTNINVRIPQHLANAKKIKRTIRIYIKYIDQME